MTAPRALTLDELTALSDDALWREWSRLDRALEDIEPCFHREHRYSRWNRDCAWCSTHYTMEMIEHELDVRARARLRQVREVAA